MKAQGQTLSQPHSESHAHPTAKMFITVGAVLFVITAIEFLIVKVEGVRTMIIALLFLLSIVKFFLVGAYFMHLKFEKKILAWVFVFGVVLALGITIGQKLINLA